MTSRSLPGDRNRNLFDYLGRHTRMRLRESNYETCLQIYLRHLCGQCVWIGTICNVCAKHWQKIMITMTISRKFIEKFIPNVFIRCYIFYINIRKFIVDEEPNFLHFDAS